MPDNEAESTPSSRSPGASTTAAVGQGSAVAVNRGTGRWRLSNWRLRTKVLAVLLIPTLTALVLAGLRGINELERQQSLQLTATQVDVASEISTVVHRLQRERYLAVAKSASGKPGTEPNLQKQTGQVNSAVVNLRSAATTLEEEDPAVRDRYDQGLQRLESLDAVRSAVNGTAYPPIAVYDVYSSIISDLIQLGREVNAAVTDRELLRSADVLQSLSEAKDYASRLDAVLQIAAAEGRFPSDLLDEARAAQASFDASETGFEANATPEERQLYSDTVSGPEVDDRARLAETAFNEADANTPLSLDADRLSRDSITTTDRMRSVQVKQLNGLRVNATELANAAQQSALRDAAIVLAALLLALLLVVLVVRSLLRPLRTLRTSALDLAYKRLPEEVDLILADPNPVQASREVVRPVPVFSKEETGEVARSFDEVHARAVELAAEQAMLRENVNAMFVNLSRRSQTLVERQLSLIDRLEADEQDPDQLSSLFELDHLATRMRRNSENLLVLAGTDLGRRLNKGVPLNDVIGAAVSEIEQYTRVQVSKAPDYVVAGSVVNDLVHLIAELLDNATMFSNPDSQVTVRAARVKTGAVGVEVTDRGVGIPDAELEVLNQRLADPPELDVSVSRRMGLYVVARLAKRHGIRVQLRENQDLDGGVIAKVVIPQNLCQRADSGSLTDTGFPLAGQSAADQTGTGATGAFAAVPDTAHERTSPAMASAGLAKAFDFSPNNGQGGGESQPPQTTQPLAQHPQAQQPQAPQQPPQDAGQNGYYPPANQNGQQQWQTPEALPDPEDPRFTGARDPQEKAAEMDVPTDRLPIYEAVLSQWFSSSPDPGWSMNEPASNGVAGQEEPMPESTEEPTSGSGLPKRVPGNNAAPERPAEQGSWDSPADEGWQAAMALSQPVEETTSAGLPKRRPKAHLVPGSASARTEPPNGSAQPSATPAPGAGQPTEIRHAVAPATVPRSAEAVRGRMSSLQRGVRRGRHAMVEANQHDESSTVESSESGQHEERE